jgi:hypothetical protein
MADVKKTPTERLREALDNLGIRTGDLAIMCEVMRARAALDELTAETPDRRAERLLGKWLVENPGWTHLTGRGVMDFRCCLRRGESEFYQVYAVGPTKAEAILDALRKAGCKDV